MFVIFTLLFTTVLAQSHEKYIDLLPEAEKQHFLDKIARRLMGTFEDADNINQFNKELTGDQHETANLRRRRTAYKSNEEENNAEENVGVIPLNSNKDAKHDSDNINSANDENASLSVEIKRRSYDAVKKKSDEVTLNSNVKTDSKSKEKETVEQLFDQTSKGEESQVEKFKDSEISTVDFHMTTERIAEITSDTDFQELLTDVTNSDVIALRTYKLNNSDDKNDLNVKTRTNDIKNSSKAEHESSEEQAIQRKLTSKESNEDESQTEKLKDPESLTTNFSTPTEEQANIISTTEFQDLMSEVTNYNALLTYEPNETNDKKDLNIKKTTNHNEADEVGNMKSMTEGESNENGPVESKENSKEELLSENMKNTETADIISTTESQDFKSDEINYTAYEPTTYEPNMITDTNDQHLKKDNVAKMTAKAILLLDLDNNNTPSIYMENEPAILHESELNNTNGEGSVLSTEYLNKESTLKTQSEQTFAYIQTSNIPDDSQGDEGKDNSTSDEASTTSISLDINDSSLTSLSTIEIDLATTANYPPVSENLSPEVALTTSTTQATVSPALTTANTVPYNNNPKSTRFKIISKPSDKNTLDTNTVSNVKKDKLESELKEKMSINHKKNEVTTVRTSVPHYQVYEIPWPDSSENPPFLRNDEPIKKLPFPVYKDLPNYLQYNPTNLLFQQRVKNNAIGRDARRLHEGGNTTNVKPEEPLVGLPKPVITKKGEIRKFGVYKKKPKKYVEEPTSPPTSMSPEDLNFEQQNTVPNHPNDQIMNDLLISNYVEDKHHSRKRIRMLTSKNNSQEDVDLSTIYNILKLTDETDVFPVLEKMLELNFKLMRRNEDVKISIYLKALSDLIEHDSKALKQYDWLATTVQIQSALEKLFLLIHKMNESKSIHPADIQILKYTVFLHNYLIELKRAKNFKTKLRNYVKLVSRDKRQRRNRGGTDKRLLHKVWGYIRRLLPDSTARDGLNDLNEFLLDVERGLYELHQAIKSVSVITKFKHQNWYQNLRQLYLTTNEKHLLQLLLHMSFSRLVELVEHSCENGLEDNFITFMKTHKKETKRTLEELMFVMMVIDEIKSSLE